MAPRRILVITVVLSLCAGVRGSLKSWGRDLNVETGSNWADSRAPCAGQTAVFPADQALSVYVHRSLVASQLVLPNNGEMIFGAAASLTLSDRVAGGDDRCRGADRREVQFRRTTGDRWYDANSWHQAALPSPVPHVERVPCAGDSVVFPDNMTYRALVQHPVAIAALTLGPYGMNNARFSAFRDSSIGRSLFDVRTGFNISHGATCTGEDCVCENHRTETLEVICETTQCQQPLCSDPIKPIGHCCKMCGAAVAVWVRDHLPVPTLSAALRALPGADGGVRWHVSRVHRRHLQAVLVDAEEGSDASRRLAKALHDRLRGNAQYGVISAIMRASGPRYLPRSGGRTGAGSSAAAVVVMLVLMVAALALLVWAAKTRRLPVACLNAASSVSPPSEWRVSRQAAALASRFPATELPRRLTAAARRATAAPFRFARFRNDETAEVELGQRAEDLEQCADGASVDTAATAGTGESEAAAVAEGGPAPNQSAATATAGPARSFDNPMYSERQTEDDHTPVSLVAPGSAICITPDGKAVENPFFGVPDFADIDIVVTPPASTSTPEETAPPKPVRTPPVDKGLNQSDPPEEQPAQQTSQSPPMDSQSAPTSPEHQEADEKAGDQGETEDPPEGDADPVDSRPPPPDDEDNSDAAEAPDTSAGEDTVTLIDISE